MPYKFIKDFYDLTNGVNQDDSNRIVSYEKKNDFYKIRYKSKDYWIYKNDPERITHILAEFNTFISGKIKGFEKILNSNESTKYVDYNIFFINKKYPLYKVPNKKSQKVNIEEMPKVKDEFFGYVLMHKWVKNKLCYKIRIYPKVMIYTESIFRENPYPKGKRYIDVWIYPFNEHGRLVADNGSGC